MTEKERQAEEAKKNQRSHRAAEAAALLLLTRARNDAVKQSGSVFDIAQAMHPNIRDAIVLARNGARERGIGRLVAEADSLGVEVSFPSQTAAFFGDWQRADRISRSYSQRWLGKAQGASPRKASLETQGSLERIAVTESSEAFSAGRAEALSNSTLYESGATRTERILSDTVLMRRWDSALDRRTCDVCAGADGTIVGIDEAFPAGEPGSVHANCRCMAQLIRVTRKD